MGVLRLSLSCHLPTPTRTPTTLVSTLDTWSAPSSTPWFPLWPPRRWRRERLRLLLRLADPWLYYSNVGYAGYAAPYYRSFAGYQPHTYGYNPYAYRYFGYGK